MKTFKETLLKLAVLFFVFVGVVALYFILTIEEPKDTTTTLETATLPVVTTNFSGTEFNVLHGYTTKMETQYMRDSITPVDENHSIPITIYRYDNNIANISYEIRTLSADRLIESTKLAEWTLNGDIITANIPLSAIVNADEEYLLTVKLTTEKHDSIYYYTRFIQQSTSEILKQLEYIDGFSRATLNYPEFKKYIGNLELDPDRNNSNLADVDIKSSYSNLTWGNMVVERVSDPIPTITEITGDTTCFEFRYKVRSKNDYDTYQYYDVTEFFRVKIGVGVTYLYVYDRTVEQIFDPITQNISKTRINLGLDSDLDVTYKANSSGSYVSFVKNNSLWCMDMKNNSVSSIFSFEGMDDTDVRTVYDQFDIEIVSTSAEGDILFIVYGYMEKGAHEGQVGVALYQYKKSDNTAKELVFVPSTKPYNILRDSVGKFAYLTKDNLLYFMIGNSIYTVTMDSNEYMQLTTNLQDGNYIINSDNNILAWHENTLINGADSIRVIDVEAHKDYTIQAHEGEYIKVLGFVENDLAYGTAKISDIYTDGNGNTVFPMYKIDVLIHGSGAESGDASEGVATYMKENVYITDVEAENNVLSLTRMSKNADGSFSPIDGDKFVNKTADNKDVITIDTITTDLKKKELVLYFAYTITTSSALEVTGTETFEFTTPNKLQLSNNTLPENVYYVYAYGKMLDTFVDFKAAIECANTNFGMVLDSSCNIAWAKITKPNLAKLTDTTVLVSKQYTSKEQILSDSAYTVYNLSGTEFSNILYFGVRDIPVITYVDNLGLVILSAYSSYNGIVDTIAFTKLDTGEIVKMTYSNAVSAVEKSGNLFLVLEQK